MDDMFLSKTRKRISKKQKMTESATRQQNLVKDLLKQFEDKAPEIVFEWSDSETEAKGWAVINSLRGGAAGGGTRMRLGLDKHEVLSLAKTMEVKFTVAGPDIGGAKSGINFDPNDPRKTGVLERWYKALKPILKSYYGTGGDLNVDEIHEVIPITKEIGIEHPQEGVFNGHFQPTPEEKNTIIKQLQKGVLLPVVSNKYVPNTDKAYTVADLITGYGVAIAVKHFYDIYGGNLKGKRAIVQGWGNVGAAAAYYLAQQGAIIVGIIDRVGGIIAEKGLSMAEIEKLIHDKSSNYLVSDHILPFDQVNEKIWDLGAEVFMPCAASRLITQEQLDRLIAAGLEVISSGANVPFADQQIFYGPISAYADSQVACIPDFISNCGMARVFAYLMNAQAKLSDEAIFEDTSSIIENALRDCFLLSSHRKFLTQTAYQIALSKLL